MVSPVASHRCLPSCGPYEAMAYDRTPTNRSRTIYLCLHVCDYRYTPHVCVLIRPRTDGRPKLLATINRGFSLQRGVDATLWIASEWSGHGSVDPQRAAAARLGFGVAKVVCDVHLVRVFT